MFKKFKHKDKETIKTADGEKKYYGTEIEENGVWDDNYSIADGYWVIHHGNKYHDIYR